MLYRKNIKEERFLLARGLSYQGGEGVTADRYMVGGARDCWLTSQRSMGQRDGGEG